MDLASPQLFLLFDQTQTVAPWYINSLLDAAAAVSVFHRLRLPRDILHA